MTASSAAMALHAPEVHVPPGLHRFELPIQDEGTLRLCIAAAFGIAVPDVQCCADHCSPWRALADAFFAKSPVAVWIGARGFSGKSFTLSLLGQLEALLLGADVNVLGGSGEQSERVLDHMKALWTRPNAPRHALKGDVAREMMLQNGALVRSLMASTRSVRGPHPQRLRIDEIDECDLEILDAALGQPMGKPGIPPQTVLSSTHHYPDGTMTEILKRAADRGWPVYRWCYRETMQPHGWLTAEQVEATRRTVTAAMWEAEYELQEPSPESRAIMTASVKAMFRTALGAFAGEPRQYIEIEAPIAHAVYATGCDLARDRDWTIIGTFRLDRKAAGKGYRGKLVAFERLGREPYPAMLARYEYQTLRYSSRSAYDGTGLGSVVKDLVSSSARGVIMAGRQRADMISEYIAAIERGDIDAPMIRHMEAEHRLASRKIYQAGDEHLPDTIAMGALAWWAANHGGGPWSGGSY